ncbi:MAG TPA: methyltransferase domain-containing protein [Polyangiaceae bacterium]|nr:methyltransferase domain-containing protein [Polyangiaceae bacterium]
MKAEQGWQNIAGERWAALQDLTDAQLGPFGRAALVRVEPRAGERALDVGCGAGQSTLELSALVGASGSVVGLDVSAPLLDRARARAASAPHANVEFVLGDAATTRLEPPFDLLFSRFGVMFFEDPVGAFTHLRTELRPGGRLGFVCWQPLAVNAWAREPLDAVRALRPGHPPPSMLEPGKPGPYFFSDPSFVAGVLGNAGFENVVIEPYVADALIGGARTLDAAVDFTLQIGPAARFVAEADLAGDERVRPALRAALAPFASERGVLAPHCTLLVTARRA